MLQFSRSKFLSILYVALPTPSRLLSCTSIIRDLRRFHPALSAGFHNFPLCSHDNHLKSICSNSDMLRLHFLSYLCRFAASLLSLFRVLLSIHLIPNRSHPFALLYFLVIFALKHLAKPNHCILIARYFVSRCSLFYVLYYLARLDSGCASGSQCTFVLYYSPTPPSPPYTGEPWLNTTTYYASGESIVSESPTRVVTYMMTAKIGRKRRTRDSKDRL